MTHPDLRLQTLERWLGEDLGLRPERVSVASADASFRRYFRAHLPGGATRIVMDAPPEHEDIGPYLRVAGLLQRIGVHVPAVHAVDAARGFVLLEDLGSTPYLGALREPGRADALYADALEALCLIQSRGAEAAATLAPYDAAVLQREMALMPEWFAARHLGLELSAADRGLIDEACARLAAAVLEQPVVFVHRDYHSRNLMALPQGGPGIIDFQDALAGPVAYDPVSLLKDCYIRWPRAQVESWLRGYRGRLRAAGAASLCGASEREFLRWFDLAGAQRHLKVLGIFARLWWRDGKPGYLDDLPLTLDYLLDACARLPELAELGAWLAREAAPRLAAANLRARAAVERR
ncbi:MAG: aminoglycoside phosphotransferase [Gammaproteobacteria bacterium]|nr:aminoglycoside phosphotransferase [Gammaproteobacteria bacterium]